MIRGLPGVGVQRVSTGGRVGLQGGQAELRVHRPDHWDSVSRLHTQLRVTSWEPASGVAPSCLRLRLLSGKDSHHPQPRSAGREACHIHVRRAVSSRGNKGRADVRLAGVGDGRCRWGGTALPSGARWREPGFSPQPWSPPQRTPALVSAPLAVGWECGGLTTGQGCVLDTH